jgi:hypothetical protein
VHDPVGPDTDAELLDACLGALHVICGWGPKRIARRRSSQVLALLRANGIAPKAVRLTRDGTPGHPLYVLYVPYDAPLVDLV